ncbi:MAG: GlsB/YeaQ/YmgE family stress response membrane protein [Pseudolysinimonas sp.]|uniref:GlsB/YeaQ/YmgE family stress response membrane protein n=1 Tax=Pseudolysinimonas sp. TaxID=2680009 RepID=UPI003C70C750
MSFIPFLILGLIAAIIAKVILKQKHGWIVTILLGLAGAALGGWIGGMVTGEDIYGVNGFWSITSWLFAIGGAVIVLLLFGLITRNRSKA